MNGRLALRVVRDVIDGKLTQVEAGAILKRTDRQIRRLCVKVKRKGNAGIRHGLCGRCSNNRLEPELLEQALSALHDPLWKGFGPTFALEKLDEYHGIRLGEGTGRKLMMSSGIWQAHRRGMRHRSWRPRRIYVGMLTQLDGSTHVRFKDCYLNFKTLSKRPERPPERRKYAKPGSPAYRYYKPAAAHPWRRYGSSIAQPDLHTFAFSLRN